MEEPVTLHFSDCDFVLSGENVRYLPGICEVLDCVNHHDFKAMPFERFRLALVVEKLCSPEGIYTSEWGYISLSKSPDKVVGKRGW